MKYVAQIPERCLVRRHGRTLRRAKLHSESESRFLRFPRVEYRPEEREKERERERERERASYDL
jgi:hypothetical protein